MRSTSSSPPLAPTHSASSASGLRMPRLQDFDPYKPSAVLFWALMVFFLLEYLRPPVLSNLKFQMLFTIVVPILWLISKDRPWSHTITLQLAMLAQAAISVVYARNYFTAFMGTRTMWANCAAALAIFWILSRKDNFTRAIWVWALIMSYQAFYAAAIGGGHGLGGFVVDENDLAMAAGTAVPFMLMGMQLFSGTKRYLSLGLLIVLVVGIVVSDSRGGFLGLAGVIGYCLFYSKNRLRNFAIIGLGGIIFALSIPSDYQDELTSIGEVKSGTAEARFFLWTAATKMWLDNPLLGVGAMNSAWLVGEYQPQVSEDGALFSGALYREKDWSTTPMHSIYFEALAETGLLGLGLLGGLVGMHYRSVSRSRKKVQRSCVADAELKRDAELYGIALSGAMTGFLVCGFFLSLLYYPFFYYFTALGASYEVMINRRLNFAEARAGFASAQLEEKREADSASPSEVRPESAPEPAEPHSLEPAPPTGPPASLGSLASGPPQPREAARDTRPANTPGLSSLLTTKKE